MTAMTIGRAARQAGVNLQTIRYYQRRGLITEPPKPRSGYRLYPSSTVARLQFIKRAQHLGFTLEEIQTLLDLGDGRCRDVQQVAQVKRDRIHTHIKDLRCMERVLDRFLGKCKKNRDPGHCSLIEALNTGMGYDNGR